jgi:molybdate transport system substrate-binding protein
MLLPRRQSLVAAPALLVATTLRPRIARAQTVTDLALVCDIAAAPAIIAAAKAYRTKSGVRVRIFPTVPSLIVPLLARNIQNDIVVTQIAAIAQAEQQDLIAPGGRVGPWRNRLVSAAAVQQAGPEGSFAVPDPTPASDIDGIAILHALGIAPAKVIGVLDTNAVAWTLTRAGARQGLLHQTEVTADQRLQAVSPIPDTAWPPILYAATVTKLTSRGDPAAFLTFLASAQGQTVLQAAGLETGT